MYNTICGWHLKVFYGIPQMIRKETTYEISVIYQYDEYDNHDEHVHAFYDADV